MVVEQVLLVEIMVVMPLVTEVEVVVLDIQTILQALINVSEEMVVKEF